MSLLKNAIPLVLAVILLASCSGDSEKEAKTGKIDTMTSEIAHEATRTIKTPIEKAQAVSDLEEQRIRTMDEQQK